MGQWPGEPMPPVPAPLPPEAYRDPAGATGQNRRVGARAAGSAEGQGKRRPVAGLVIWVVAVVTAAPVLLLLRDSMFGPSLSPSGVISSVLVLLALPLGALGIHALGTNNRVDYSAPRAWLRPPVAYLPIALVLLLAAGLAAA